jgi:peptide/nickel transport system permease protein
MTQERARAIALTLAVRGGHALLSIFLLTILVFLMIRVTGDPAKLMLPDTATAADIARLQQRLGLDRPLLDQYFLYIGQLVRGDFGEAVRLRASVGDLILQRLPATVELALAGLAIALLVGIPLGMYAAYYRGRAFDRIVRGVATIGQSAPSFWVGLLLILLFAVTLDWLPAGGHGKLENLILPAIAVSIVPIAALTRLLRSSMLEVLSSDYVKFLRIKGVSETEILWKHGLRNAGLTTLTYVGVVTAGLLTGSLVTELVFTWPGIGLLVAQSIEGRDFTVVQGVVTLISIVYIVVNLIVDVLYAVLNPRLR